MKSVITLIFILGLFQVATAQTQTVKGTIEDLNSGEKIIGASVIVQGTDPLQGAVTDAAGEFIISNVPIGRRELVVQFIGYKSQTIPNVLVTAGKEVVLQVKLEESVEKLQEVVIRDGTPDQPLNELAMVSARTFDTEQVLRFSGGRNDVARLVTSFAGVSAPDDSRNDIVVRGNSPVGLLWRIEGIPVATTNHFATLGTTGGPVNALNTNLLRKSDFLTGAFPAEYGNANAAVFDVNFRNGNKDNFEFTGQISAFSGAEAMVEGPLNRKNGGSFVASYRYGIASLAATGTTSIPYYQDFSFKANLGEMSWGKLELFGMGGLSNIDFLGDDIEDDDLFANPNQDAFVDNELGLVGMKHTLRLDRKSYIITTLGASTNYNQFLQDNLIRDENGEEINSYRATNSTNRENRLTAHIQYNRKFNARWNMQAGVLNERYIADSHTVDRDNRTDLPDNDDDGIPDEFATITDVDDRYNIFQSYAQGEFKITDDLSVTAGLHSQYHGYTTAFMIEPRAGVSWQFRPGQRFSFAYGLHGQSIPSPILFYEEEVAEGEYVRTNDELDFMKSHHFVLSYDRHFGSNWHLKTEAYYQALFDVPVQSTPGSYSVINEGADFVFDEQGSLVNEGTGRNMGIELTLEKFFSNNYYILLTGSFFDSKYEGSDGIERNTAFNNRVVMNVLFGREWKFGSNDQNAFTFDTRVTASGGTPYTPIDLEATRANGGREVLFTELAFSERYEPYFRWDVKFGVRLNSKRKNISHQFFIDLQNITNRENQFVDRYNEVTDEINTVNQIGFFPDIMYRIQF